MGTGCENKCIFMIIITWVLHISAPDQPQGASQTDAQTLIGVRSTQDSLSPSPIQPKEILPTGSQAEGPASGRLLWSHWTTTLLHILTIIPAGSILSLQPPLHPTQHSLWPPLPYMLGFPYSSVSKESACNAGDPGSIPRSGRSPGEGSGNPLQYSCL